MKPLLMTKRDEGPKHCGKMQDTRPLTKSIAYFSGLKVSTTAFPQIEILIIQVFVKFYYLNIQAI